MHMSVCARKIIIVVAHINLILVNGIRWQRYGIVAIVETQYKLLECTYITVVSHTGHRDFIYARIMELHLGRRKLFLCDRCIVKLTLYFNKKELTKL